MSPIPVANAQQPDQELCAVRGTQVLKAQELQAHLAALLDLTNVGVFLGAGASLCAGGKTMPGISREITRRCQAMGAADPVQELRQSHQLTLDNNVEHAWTTLRLLKSASTHGALLPRTRAKLVKRALDIYEEVLIDSSRLARVVWPGSPHPQLNPPPSETLKHHEVLLRKLVLSREPGHPAPWVFTTNYDLAVEWAAEREEVTLINGFDGLHSRGFRPQVFDTGFYNTQARGEARFGNTYVYTVKLHGSLSWLVRSNGIVEEVPASLITREIASHRGKELGKRDPLPFVLVPPSAAKYDDTLGFVHGEMFRRFAEFVARPQTLLVCNGFGFWDEHVNRIVRAALQNPTFHIVICSTSGTVEEDDGVGRAVLPATQSPTLKALAAAKHPSVTFVCGEQAKFDKFVSALPDPAIHDQMARNARKTLQGLLSAASRGNSTS